MASPLPAEAEASGGHRMPQGFGPYGEEAAASAACCSEGSMAKGKGGRNARGDNSET
mgnify:CR=1 FL=1